MKIYQTETQEDYDALMVELIEKGLTDIDCSWEVHKELTCLRIDNGNIYYGNKKSYEKLFSELAIEKYKVKRQLPELEKVFRLNGKDLTFFKLEKSSSSIYGARMMFYMRYEKLWMYSPEDKMDNKFWKDLDKKGFRYVEDEFNEEVERLENFYKGE